MAGSKLRILKNRLQNILLASVFAATQLAVPILATRIVEAAALPTNKVGFSSSGFVLGDSYSVVAGQPTGAGQLKNGNVGGYPEGACIPAEFKVKNNDNVPGDTVVSPIFDYNNGGAFGITNYEKVTTGLSGDPAATADNLNDFTFSGQPLSASSSFPVSSGGSVSATVTGPFSNDTAGTAAITTNDAARHYNIALSNIPAGATVYIMLCGRLSLDASQYPGASLSLRTVQGGSENVPIPVNQILVLPSITINKSVVQGTALPSDFSFTVSPNVNGQSVFNIPAGQNSVTINNVNPDGIYSITESGPAAYRFTGGTGLNCTAVATSLNTVAGQMTASVAAGNPQPTNATCNFTNTQNTGTIKLIKNVIKNNGGTAQPDDFGLTIGGTPVTSGVAQTLNPGSYAVNEAGLSGYGFVNITGTGCPTSLGGNVTLTSNQNITCTITNDDIAPQLTVIKNVTKDNGGNEVASNFTMNVTGTNVSSKSFSGASGAGTTVTLDAGAYSVSEDAFPGYTGSYSDDCIGGTIAVGEKKTCTVTNNDDAPSLTLVKSVINDNKGPLNASNFTLHLTGGAYNGTQSFVTGATPTVVANTAYTFSEDNNTGYAQTSLDCTDDTTNLPVSHPVTLNEGQHVTCTITNDDIAPLLTVTKTVASDSGGTLVVSSFPLFVGDIQVTSDVQNSFNAGAVTVSEANQNGYLAGEWGGACSVNGSITLEVGGVYSCTITNNDVPASIKVTKQITENDGGNAQVSDFTLKVDNTTVLSGVNNTFNGNAEYTISEVPQVTGYTQTSLTCLDVTGDGGISVGATFTAQLGHSYECTVVNDDVAPTVTLSKSVVNNNSGKADVNDFGLTVGGNSVTSGQTVNMKANTAIALNEVGLTGYHFTSLTGTGCPATLGGTVTLTPGQNISCTITNDDDSHPRIQILKTSDVSQYHVGDTITYTFTVTNTGDSPLDNISATDPMTGLSPLSAPTGDTGNDGVLGTGEVWTYTATLVVPASAGSSISNTGTVCGHDTLATPSVQLNFIAVPPNQVCDHDNHDVDVLKPAIHVVKSGPSTAYEGDKVTYTFTVTNTGNVALDSLTVSDSIAGSGAYKSGDTIANNKLDPSETWIYTADYTIPTPQIADVVNTVTTCGSDALSKQICDTDQHTLDVLHPTITVIKSIVSSNADTGLFNLLIDGNLLAANVSNNGTTGTVAVKPGPHTISETAGTNTDMADYSSSFSKNCSDGMANVEGDDNVSCIITNTRLGSVTIVKDAKPNTDQAFTFTGNLDGDASPNFNLADDGVHPELASKIFSRLSAGTYNATEPPVKGWSLDSITCKGSSDYNPNNRNVVIKLQPGENVICTFVNSRDVGTITVHKIALPSNTDTDFTINLTNTSDQSLAHQSEIAGGESDSYQVVTGEYNLAEIATEGWDLTSATCSSSQLESTFDPRDDSFEVVKNDNIDCTFINEKHGSVIVTKYNDLNRNGSYDPSDEITPEPTLADWDITLGNAKQTTGEDGTTTFNDLSSGPYSLDEVIQDGWNRSAPNITCDDNQEIFVDFLNEGLFSRLVQTGRSVNIAPGATVHCFIGNYRNPALNIAKSNDRPNPVLIGDIVTYTLTVTVPTNSGAVFNATATDLPPEGFKYIPGSWTANSSARGDIKADGITTEPTYGSPGVWNLGTLLPGEIVTLTYQTKVNNDVSGGTYPDLAFASGCEFASSESDCDVLSNVSTGSDTPFVSTSVRVQAPAVLGASVTVLVKTGIGIWQNILIGGGLLIAALATQVRREKKGGQV